MKYCLVFVLYFTFSSLSSNDRTDSLRMVLSSDLSSEDRITTTQQLFGALVDAYPESALVHAREALALSAVFNDENLHGKSIMNLTHAYFVNNEPDSAKLNLLESKS